MLIGSIQPNHKSTYFHFKRTVLILSNYFSSNYSTIKIFDVDESFRISFSLFVAKMNFKTFLGRKNTMKVRQLKAFFQHEGFSQDAMWWPSLRSANLIKSLRAFKIFFSNLICLTLKLFFVDNLRWCTARPTKLPHYIIRSYSILVEYDKPIR